ncbi:hypothetical protein [Clostridium tyrobutyricum]|uniref:hypothetical protein n=1 Tax=Clostridium tyrobutyricum TaxID=1519 RepID=UPI0030D15694
MENSIYFKEDTSKAENRVNITLFHLLMNNDIKKYIDKKLKLDQDTVIYPASNLITEEFNTNDRPDFNIVKNEEVIGYIEVELGKDIAQVKKYNEKTPKNVKIYSIFGRKHDGGDLSLEEIYEFVKIKQESISNNSQTYWSIELLLNLLKYYIINGNFKNENKRTSISDKMKNTNIIKNLYEGIGKEKILDKIGDKSRQGMILINTIKDNGFSIRAFSRNASNRSFSIMARSGGRQLIQFPSYKKLKYYISNNEFVEKYTELLVSLGAKDIKEIEKEQRETLDLSIVEEHINDIVQCIKILID